MRECGRESDQKQQSERRRARDRESTESSRAYEARFGRRARNEVSRSRAAIPHCEPRPEEEEKGGEDLTLVISHSGGVTDDRIGGIRLRNRDDSRDAHSEDEKHIGEVAEF
jgi:hypothetical protein